jgi:hypothetical protein
MVERTGGQVTIRLAVKDSDRVRQALRDLGRDGEKALRQLDEAARPASRSLEFFGGVIGGARSEVESLADRLGPIAGALRGLGPGGLIAGAAIAGVGTAALTTMRSLTDLKRQAQTAGIDVESFQRLRILAIDTGVGVDALTDGIKELQLRTDEFVQTGGGPAAESFARMGLSADDLKQKLKDPADLFLTIIGRLQRLDQAARVRVMDEVFGGTAAERFAALVDQGEQSLRNMIQTGEDAGRVIKEEMVEKAAALDREFQKVADTIDGKVKSAVVGVASILGEWAEHLGTIFNTLDATTGSLAARLAEAREERHRLQQAVAAGLLPPGITANLDAEISGLEQRLLELERKRQEAAKEALGAGLTGGKTDRLEPFFTLDEIRQAQLLRELQKSEEDRATRVRPFNGQPALPPEKPNTLSLPPDQNTEAVERQRDTIREHIEALEEELRLVGKSAVEQRIAAEIRSLGADATAEQRAEVERLVRAIAAEEEAQKASEEARQRAAERLREVSGEMKGLTRDFLGGLANDLKNGASLVDALGNAFERLADRLLDLALDELVNSLFDAPSSSPAGGATLSEIGSRLVDAIFGTQEEAAAAQTAPVPATRPVPRAAGAATAAAVTAEIRPLATGTRLDPASAFATLRQAGYSDVQAAAVLGNMRQESGLNLAALNKKEGAFGALQWRLDRRDNLDALAARMGVEPSDARAQFGHLDRELRGVYGGEARHGRAFFSATDLEGANKALKGYIRYGDDSENTRLGYAREYLDRFGGGKTDGGAAIALEKLGESAADTSEQVGTLGSGAGEVAKAFTDATGDLGAVGKQATTLVSAGDALASAGEKTAENATSFSGALGNAFSQVLGGFGDLVTGGLSAIGNLLKSGVSALAGGGGGGGLGGLLSGILGAIGSLFGFDQGGFTGDAPRNAVTGVVHGREFVMDADATEALGTEELEEMRRTRRNSRAERAEEARRRLESRLSERQRDRAARILVAARPEPVSMLEEFARADVERRVSADDQARRGAPPLARDPRPAGASGERKPAFTQVIHNHGAGMETREEEDSQGNRRQEMVISAAVGRAVTKPGPARSALGTMGVKPPVTRR